MNPFDDIKLKILVFGPNPNVPTSPGFSTDLAKKRKDIRDALISDGHQADFPEDLMRGSVDPVINNSYIWEDFLVRKYDMVVNLVCSYGTVTELSYFMDNELALKAALFFCEDHTAGLAYQQAKVIEAKGANLHTYTYPNDIAVCNLMKNVRQQVWVVRVCKFYS